MPTRSSKGEAQLYATSSRPPQHVLANWSAAAKRFAASPACVIRMMEKSVATEPAVRGCAVLRLLGAASAHWRGCTVLLLGRSRRRGWSRSLLALRGHCCRCNQRQRDARRFPHESRYITDLRTNREKFCERAKDACERAGFTAPEVFWALPGDPVVPVAAGPLDTCGPQPYREGRSCLQRWADRSGPQ